MSKKKRHKHFMELIGRELFPIPIEQMTSAEKLDALKRLTKFDTDKFFKENGFDLERLKTENE